MKVNLLATFLLTLTVFFSFSCSKNDSSNPAGVTTYTSTQSYTWVKLTATTAANVNKPNYIIMMFDQPVTSTTALPPIIKQVTTDANGLAYFDLKTIVTTSTLKTYYFEAFTQTTSGYMMESVTHPAIQMKSGNMITSSIIVN